MSTNEEMLLERLNPELARVWKAVRVLLDKYGGTGDIEVHFYKGRIKIKDGLFIKPSYSDETDLLKDK